LGAKYADSNVEFFWLWAERLKPESQGKLYLSEEPYAKGRSQFMAAAEALLSMKDF